MTQSDKILKENISLDIENDISIIDPKPIKKSFRLDGVPYIVLIESPDSPLGIQADPVNITTVIGWDDKIYIDWEIADTINQLDLTVEDLNDNLIALLLDYNEPLTTNDTLNSVILRNDQDLDINNGSDYTTFIESIQGADIIKSPEVVIKVRDRTVQNLTKNDEPDGSITLSWDAIQDYVLHYEIVLENSDTGNIIDIIQSSDNIENILPDIEAFYNIYVRAISLKEIFTGGNSNVIQIYISAKPQNFIVTVEGGVMNSSWDSVEGTDGYNIYRQPPNGSYTKINTSLILDENFSTNSDNWINGQHNFYVIPVKNDFEGSRSDVVTKDISNIIIDWNEDGGDTITGIVFESGPIEVNWNEESGDTVTLT